MFSIVRYTVLVVCATISAERAESQQKSDWIRIQHGPDYHINANGSGASAYVPVQLDDGIAWSGVRFRVKDVRIGNRSDHEWLDALSLKKDGQETAATSGPGIIIRVDPAKAASQGVYRVLLEAAVRGRSPVGLELLLNRPAAKLVANRIKVERVSTWGGETDGTLIVEEESGLSVVIGLNAQPPSLTTAESGFRGGTLRLTYVPDTIPAGGADSIRYALAGAFPLGIATGVLQIRSQQLVAPFDVPVEIRTRRSYLWLSLAIVVGLLGGWIYRTLLQRRAEVGQARVAGLDLLALIEGQLSRTSDSDFRTAMAGVGSTLRASLAGSDPQTIKTSVVQADVDFRKAVVDLDGRLAFPQIEIQQLRNLEQARLFLPQEIEYAVQMMRPSLDEIEVLVAKRDAGTATQRTQLVLQTLEESLRKFVVSWVVEQIGSWDHILSIDSSLPASAQRAAAGIAHRSRRGLDAVRVIPPNPSAAEFISVLEGIHQVRLDEQPLSRRIAESISDSTQKVVHSLMEIAHRNDELIWSLKKAGDDFSREVGKAADHPEQALSLLSGSALAGVKQLFSKAILAHVQAVPAEQRKQIEDLVIQREYETAADTLSRLSAKAPPGYAIEELSIEETGTPLDGLAGYAPLGHRNPLLSLSGVRVDLTPEIPPISVERGRAVKEIFRATMARTIVAGSLIFVVGFLLYSPAYIGTFKECAAIFLWAFGLDVSADAVLKERPQSA